MFRGKTTFKKNLNIKCSQLGYPVCSKSRQAKNGCLGGCVSQSLALTPAVHGRNGAQFLVSRAIWVHRSPVQAQNQRYSMILGVCGSGVGGTWPSPAGLAGWALC